VVLPYRRAGHEQVLLMVEAVLGGGAFAAAYEASRATSLDKAVGFAQEASDDAPDLPV
jgi:hypothetical protein